MKENRGRLPNFPDEHKSADSYCDCGNEHEEQMNQKFAPTLVNNARSEKGGQE